MVFSAYLLENTILVLSQGGEFALYFLGICNFVLEKLQMPLDGAQNIVQIPHPWTTPIENCIFQ